MLTDIFTQLNGVYCITMLVRNDRYILKYKAMN